jgi:hypothetical protein
MIHIELSCFTLVPKVGLLVLKLFQPFAKKGGNHKGINFCFYKSIPPPI